MLLHQFPRGRPTLLSINGIPPVVDCFDPAPRRSTPHPIASSAQSYPYMLMNKSENDPTLLPPPWCICAGRTQWVGSRILQDRVLQAHCSAGRSTRRYMYTREEQITGYQSQPSLRCRRAQFPRKVQQSHPQRRFTLDNEVTNKLMNTIRKYQQQTCPTEYTPPLLPINSAR